MGSCSPMGLPLYLSILKQSAFEKKIQGISDHVRVQRMSLKAFLVEKIGAIGIAIEIGRGNSLQIWFRELVASLERLVEDSTREHVAQLQTYQRLTAACGWLGGSCF